MTTRFRDELRILRNISDCAFCQNSFKLKAVKGFEYASELACKVKDVSFLNLFEHQR